MEPFSPIGDQSPFEDQQSSGVTSYSRYTDVGTRTSQRSDGRKVVHLKRRFIPKPNELNLIHEHQLQQGERLDHIAYQYFQNAELDWRICDANGATHPDELLKEVGRILRIADEHDDQGVEHA